MAPSNHSAEQYCECPVLYIGKGVGIHRKGGEGALPGQGRSGSLDSGSPVADSQTRRSCGDLWTARDGDSSKSVQEETRRRGHRLERTGMRWCVSGAQAMLNLRSLNASTARECFQHPFLNSSPTQSLIAGSAVTLTKECPQEKHCFSCGHSASFHSVPANQMGNEGLEPPTSSV